jgi:hypothetical protein
MISYYLRIWRYSIDTQNTKKTLGIIFIYLETKILKTHFWYSLDTQITEKTLCVICYENNLYLYTDVYTQNNPEWKIPNSITGGYFILSINWRPGGRTRSPGLGGAVVGEGVEGWKGAEELLVAAHETG